MAKKSKLVTLAGLAFLVASVFGVTEAFVRLDLTPILMLLPASVLIGLAAFFTVNCIALFGFQLWYRKSQFTLSSILLVCVLVAWPAARLSGEIASDSRRANAVRKCVERIRELGPTGECTLSGRFREFRTLGRRSIRKTLFMAIAPFVSPVDPPLHMSRLYTVDLSSTEANDSDVKLIAATEVVDVLVLSNTAITDKGLEHLSTMHSLGELHMKNVTVSDEAITQFQRRMPNTVLIR